MTESTKHDRIYLQVCDDADSEWCGDVTWCQDRIHDDDVEYIRTYMVDQLRAALALARDALTIVCDYAVKIDDCPFLLGEKALAAIDEAIKDKT